MEEFDPEGAPVQGEKDNNSQEASKKSKRETFRHQFNFSNIQSVKEANKDLKHGLFDETSWITNP